MKERRVREYLQKLRERGSQRERKIPRNTQCERQRKETKAQRKKHSDAEREGERNKDS